MSEDEIRIKEQQEEELIKKGGIYPWPWYIKWNDVNSTWELIPNNGIGVIVWCADKLVAERICELMNAHRVVFLEEGIIY